MANQVIMPYANFKQDLITSYNHDAKRRKGNENDRDRWKADVREKFLKLLQSEHKTSLLELGAGIGTDALYFMQNGLQVTAIDISEGMVKECISRGINAKVMDLFAISTLDQTFDSIYSMNVMLHIPRKDLKVVLKNIAKLLNENGLFYYGSYGGITEEKILNSEKTNNLPRFFSTLNDEDLLEATEMFKKVNFDVVELNSDQKNFHYQSLILRK